MKILDIASLLILGILLVGALVLVLIVAAIPGQLAKKRHSPWVEAINVAGWISLSTFVTLIAVRESTDYVRR